MAFPDGSRLVSNMRVDVPNRVLHILEPGAEEPREVAFDYDSPGLGIYSMVAGPEGKIYGATGLPLRIWQFDPETGEMRDGGLGSHGGHVNQWVRQGDLLYGAVYSSGSLIEYDPTRPYDDAPIRESTNPRHLHGYGEARDLYGRPAALLAHPDGRHVILGGSAARVHVGGGILIYDTETGEETVLGRDDLIADQGVTAIAALPDGDLIVGTTISAPTAGQTVATDAMIYRIDWESKALVGRWTIDPRTSAVRDLIVPEDGLVYGLTTDNRFFVFDPESAEFVHDEEITAYGGGTGGQASRVMAIGPEGEIYVLFREAIARIEPGTFEHTEVVRPGPTITTGITIADGRLYFACGARLFSYDLGTAD
jgi:acyl dehydratase